jgi:hypothetical protein
MIVINRKQNKLQPGQVVVCDNDDEIGVVTVAGEILWTGLFCPDGESEVRLISTPASCAAAVTVVDIRCAPAFSAGTAAAAAVRAVRGEPGGRTVMAP